MLPSQEGIRTLASRADQNVTNNLFREKMTHPRNELVLSQMSKPWTIIKRIVGLVIVTYLLSNSILMVFFGMYLGDLDGFLLSFIGLFCSLPLLFTFFWIRRPRLIHIQLAIPNEKGKKTHILQNNETLVTPIPTLFSHHLVKDSGLLDLPPSKNLWLIFSSVLTVSILIFIALLNKPSDLIILFTIIFAIPAWLIGFSIPVFAWWSYSARNLNMPTTGYRAESALVAGLICTIPALIINTSADIFLSEIFGLNSPISQLILLAMVAPVGEELCKLGAIWWCKEFIDSPRRGFEIGFTVGLGFAILENLQYIAISWAGGPLSFTITSLIRAIGSIPGHAFWTGLTGIGFAWFALKNKKENSELNQNNDENKWQLINSRTNEIIDTTIDNNNSSRELNENNELFYLKEEENEIIKGDSKLPKSLGLGLLLAIVGHSFWNGSSFLVDYFANKFTTNIIFSTISSLFWIIILISGMLLIGRLILQNVRLLPDKMV
jgi:RsiW-degrading membrane proteinase PrsW (M82 family)